MGTTKDALKYLFIYFGDREMANITVTTTINAEVWKEARQKGVKMSHLILLGWRAFNENPQLIQRINELEQGNARLQNKITRLMERVYELEDVKK